MPPVRGQPVHVPEPRLPAAVGARQQARRLGTAGLPASAVRLHPTNPKPHRRHVIEFFEGQHGVEVRQCWGMTELSPLGTIGAVKASPLSSAAAAAAAAAACWLWRYLWAQQRPAWRCGPGVHSAACIACTDCRSLLPLLCRAARRGWIGRG